MENIERIGKITLDYSKYPGEDFYCDGAVEDELLDIVKNRSEVEYAQAIEEKKNWPILYHLSPLRENIVEWIPMEKNAKVLEVGSGCGAVTGALARKAGNVVCVDLSKKRSLINAYRHAECDNVTIHVGNFKDIEPDLADDFDYICLIGVFEYGQSYIGGDTPYEDFVKILLPHLKKGGRIIIAIENKYGMKYFAGCKEDHLGSYFSGIENYAQGGVVRTFSRIGLERIFRRCGVQECHFYYPYPDYKFMTSLYSDSYWPSKGELSNNLRNFDRDRMLLFDEKSAFDGTIEEGVFSIFANSYVAVIGKDFDVKFAKYSNDRAEKYAIRTEIGRDAKGIPYVRKYPLSKAAEEHIRGMAAAYEKLVEKYSGGNLEINKCELVEGAEGIYAQFDYVDGKPLSQLMDTCLEKDDMEGFYKLFDEYIERVGYNSEYPVADYDLIFANILVTDNNWTLIDYEWTFGKATPIKELVFRAIYCYILEDEKRNKLDLGRILDKLDITEQEAEGYRMQEREFQHFVTGNRLSMSQIQNLWGGEVLQPQNWIDDYKAKRSNLRVQIYEDCGKGYSEEQSRFVPEAYLDDEQVEFTVTVSGNVKMLRIDPAMCPCVCKLQELTFNGVAVPVHNRKIFIVNGKLLKAADGNADCPGVVFATEDPNMNINVAELQPKAENTLCARMQVVKLPLAIAQDMAGAVKKLI